MTTPPSNILKVSNYLAKELYYKLVEDCGSMCNPSGIHPLCTLLSANHPLTSDELGELTLNYEKTKANIKTEGSYFCDLVLLRILRMFVAFLDRV